MKAKVEMVPSVTIEIHKYWIDGDVVQHATKRAAQAKVASKSMPAELIRIRDQRSSRFQEFVALTNGDGVKKINPTPADEGRTPTLKHAIACPDS